MIDPLKHSSVGTLLLVDTIIYLFTYDHQVVDIQYVFPNVRR